MFPAILDACLLAAQYGLERTSVVLTMICTSPKFTKWTNNKAPRREGLLLISLLSANVAKTTQAQPCVLACYALHANSHTKRICTCPCPCSLVQP